MTSLEGKVIAITGAASGIGEATARLLAARGASLSLSDYNQEALRRVGTGISSLNPSGKIHLGTVNVVKNEEVTAWLDETVRLFGKLDGAANMAGVIGDGFGQTKVEDLTDEQWDSAINVNLRGVFNCLRAQLQRIKGASGSIVNASSVAGLRGVKQGAPYCASKHAVIGLTQSAANEVGERNIRVNCIAPGPIDTPMLHSLVGWSDRKDSSERLAIKRQGAPDEVAKLIAFLLSDESTYITGSVVSIDGGFNVS